MPAGAPLRALLALAGLAVVWRALARHRAAPGPGWAPTDGSDASVYLYIGERRGGGSGKEGALRARARRGAAPARALPPPRPPIAAAQACAGRRDWARPDRVPTSPHSQPPPPLLRPDPFESGLNNERISLLKAAEVASRNGYTLVLPAFKDFHGVLRRGDPADPVVLDFSHFYDEAAFAAHAAQHGFKVARTMPVDRFHACAKELNFASQFADSFDPAFISAYASRYRVVCLPPHAVWFAIQGYGAEDLDWSANAKHAAGLKPSPLYARELARMEANLVKKFGTSSFVAVHVRSEADWAAVCEMGSDRSEPHWLTGQPDRCMVTDVDIAAHLRRQGVGKGSLAFVMSGDDVAASAPRLCGPAGHLRCFTPDDVWGEVDARVPVGRTILPRAYVSFLLAGRASSLFGNRHSTFSTELASEFRLAGKEASFYNPPCPQNGPCP